VVDRQTRIVGGRAYRSPFDGEVFYGDRTTITRYGIGQGARGAMTRCLYGSPGGMVIVFSIVTAGGGNSSELRGTRTASRNPAVAIAIIESAIQTTLRNTIGS
jgi:hypothetical protein